jgi:hypothetical protein
MDAVPHAALRTLGPKRCGDSRPNGRLGQVLGLVDPLLYACTMHIDAYTNHPAHRRKAPRARPRTERR